MEFPGFEIGEWIEMGGQPRRIECRQIDGDLIVRYDRMDGVGAFFSHYPEGFHPEFESDPYSYIQVMIHPDGDHFQVVRGGLCIREDLYPDLFQAVSESQEIRAFARYLYQEIGFPDMESPFDHLSEIMAAAEAMAV